MTHTIDQSSTEKIAIQSDAVITPAPEPPYAKVVGIDTYQEKPTIRARIETDDGELYVVSKGKEATGHITIPSVLGAEGDMFYQGNYAVMYKHNKGEQELEELKNLVFVQPSDQPVSLEKISFDAMDVFLLTPEYIGSRGFNSYAFGVDRKSGEAFTITFKKDASVWETINYEKMSTPLNKNDKLVVTTRNTEGQGDTLTVEYRFDRDTKQFIAE